MRYHKIRFMYTESLTKNVGKYQMSQITQGSSFNVSSNVTADLLKAHSSKNPALQRLSAKLNSGFSTGAAIERYERMHHRHSRN